MHPDKHSDIIDIGVGNPEMDGDHHALVLLIEKVGLVCENSLNQRCDCDKCPEGNPQLCFATLIEIGHEIMVRMLEHFHHEDDLMKSLPRNHSTVEHCLVHRGEHVSFSTRYNRAVAQISARQPVIGLRSLDTFITDWIRSHILEYDMKLAALLKVHSPNR
jgi:hemerythrin-like metal-binding protein